MRSLERSLCLGETQVMYNSCKICKIVIVVWVSKIRNTLIVDMTMIWQKHLSWLCLWENIFLNFSLEISSTFPCNISFLYWWLNINWISRATNYMIRRMPLPNPIFSGKWSQKVSLNIYRGAVVSIDQIISWIRYWIEDWGDEVTSFPKNIQATRLQLTNILGDIWPDVERNVVRIDGKNCAF